MLTPGASAFSLSNGVRSAMPRIFSRAAATSPLLGRVSAAADPASPFLEVNDLSHAGGARFLQHEVRGRQILRRNAERFVQCHVERRYAADLGVISDLADLGRESV